MRGGPVSPTRERGVLFSSLARRANGPPAAGDWLFPTYLSSSRVRLRLPGQCGTTDGRSAVPGVSRTTRIIRFCCIQVYGGNMLSIFRWLGRGTASAAKREPARRRLGCERLEDRTVPTILSGVSHVNASTAF